MKRAPVRSAPLEREGKNIMRSKIRENAVELPVDLRDWFAIHGPEPREWWLKQQQQIEASDLQLMVKWRWVWADAMIAGERIESSS
jgi:hypothetical protein